MSSNPGGIGALAHVPLVNPRTGLITREWFRYLTGANATTSGSAHEVLHGNSGGGYPTYSPVDLAADVEGKLPIANGGIGGVSGVAGGVMTFSAPDAVVSSPALSAHALVIGGGAAGTPSTPVALGTTHQVLHGNATGDPAFSALDLTEDVTGTLPVANGGTGVTTATGTGSVVRQTAPTINGSTLGGPSISGFWAMAGATAGAQFFNLDSHVSNATGAGVVILTVDHALFFIAHDLTSGGISVGVMDSTGVSMLVSGISNVTFSHSSGLKATVTGGADPRSISLLAFEIGTL